jgi:hypothetical protein
MKGASPRGTTRDHFREQERRAQQDQAGNVDQDERATAVLTRKLRKPPELPEPRCGARCRHHEDGVTGPADIF